MIVFGFRECVVLFVSALCLGLFPAGESSIKLIFYNSDIISFLYSFNVQLI